ncbi:thioredoxin domain-containing protein [Paenibacillus sp. LHD-117]|uniref:DsbA family protein n=1 Tax=Paenibacillus sp. LHD-117 TaxID=3071412 RepID=UPI0027E1E3E8|nr:thioredoxin domain-containing protein [Paenibacillus sp. LHD-117]MDQ6419796.1 thioredoxin domain-containing protein [Paenibacillus sp. LHD-117]
MSAQARRNKKASGSRNFVLYTAIIILIVVLLVVINQVQKKNEGENRELSVAPSTESQPVLGDANAKVSIVEFGDYMCPSCKQWGETIWPQLQKDYVDTGKATFSYVNVDFHNQPSITGAVASESILQSYPEQFWAFHKALFDAQPTTNHDSAWLTEDKVVEVAKATVPTLDEAAFRASLTAEEPTKQFELDKALYQEFKVNQTPTIMINETQIANPFDYAAIKAAIEQNLE